MALEILVAVFLFPGLVLAFGLLFRVLA